MALNLNQFQSISGGIRQPETSLSDVVGLYNQHQNQRIDNAYKQALTKSKLYELEVADKTREEKSRKEKLQLNIKLKLDPLINAAERGIITEDELNQMAKDGPFKEDPWMYDYFGKDPYFYVDKDRVVAKLAIDMDPDTIAEYEQKLPHLRGRLREDGDYIAEVDAITGEELGIVDRNIEVNQLDVQSKSAALKQSSNRQVQSLRKEFMSNPVIKNSQEISSAVSRMDSVWNNYKSNPNSLESKNALDQALVITFNKMLDPGSVVRESEFARTPQGQSLINRALGLLGKAESGGVGLTDEEREEIYSTARLLEQGQQEEVSKIKDFFNTEAGSIGVDQSRVTGIINTDIRESNTTISSQLGGLTQEEQQILQTLGVE